MDDIQAQWPGGERNPQLTALNSDDFRCFVSLLAHHVDIADDVRSFADSEDQQVGVELRFNVTPDGDLERDDFAALVDLFGQARNAALTMRGEAAELEARDDAETDAHLEDVAGGLRVAADGLQDHLAALGYGTND